MSGTPKPGAGIAEVQVGVAVRSAFSTDGTRYTWQDGDHTRGVRLVASLVLQSSKDNTDSDVVVRDDGKESIVLRQARHKDADTKPVFVAETGGGLLTLPGGVLLALDRDWDESRIGRFFSDNHIGLDRVSASGFSENAFFVETEPGLPSLELANALAGQKGVRISSPNWAHQLELR